MGAAAAAGIIAGGALIAGKMSSDASGDAVKAQEDQNKANEAFIREMRGQSRSDALTLQPVADQVRAQGYQSSIDMLRGATPQQIDLTARGNIAGQEALLAGFPQIQNAILGMPVDMSGLQATDLRTPGMLDWMQGATVPQTPTDYSSLLGGGGRLNFTPGETTNRGLIEEAHRSGTISDSDYDWLIKLSMERPDVAGNINWGSAGASDQLISKLSTGGLTPGNQEIMTRLFQSIYPNQPGNNLGGTA
jgi:hypothetical protein